MFFRPVLLALTAILLHFATMAQTRDSVLIPVAGGRMGATLTVPKNTPRPAVAIIIAGSGGVDRNGNANMVVNNLLKLLSDSLAKYGIASLRYDKRGVGTSKRLTDETRLQFSDYVPDAIACYKWLQQQKRFGKIFIVGHDEGALIAALAAQKVKPAGLIAIASPGESADRLILGQLIRQGQHQSTIDSTRMFFDRLRAQGRIDSIPPIGFYQAMFRPSVQKYLASWIRFDPAAELAKVTVPVLIVHGTHDLPMDSVQFGLLRKAKPEAQVAVIRGMNHVLRQTPADIGQNLDTYYNPQLPIDSTLVRAVRDFVTLLIRD